MQPDDTPSYRLPISKGHRRLGIGNYDVGSILLRLFFSPEFPVLLRLSRPPDLES